MGARKTAFWDGPKKLNEKLTEGKSKAKPLRLSEHVSAGIDGKYSKNSLHTLLIGGTGSGKTVSFEVPNILQKNMSYVIFDHGLETYNMTKDSLRKSGYNIQVMDLTAETGRRIDLFEMLRSEGDFYEISEIFFRKSGDPFFEEAECQIFSTVLRYIKRELPENKHNVTTLLKFLKGMKGDMTGDTDKLFSALSEKKRKEYNGYFNLTWSSEIRTRIIVYLLSETLIRCQKALLIPKNPDKPFEKLDLSRIFKKKTAIFIEVPTNSFDPVIYSLICKYLVSTIYEIADTSNWERTYKVRFFITGEFTSCLNHFDYFLGTARARGIAISVAVQTFDQLSEVKEKGLLFGFDYILLMGGYIDHNTVTNLTEFLNKSKYISTFTKCSDRITEHELLTIEPTKVLIVPLKDRPVLDQKIKPDTKQ